METDLPWGRVRYRVCGEGREVVFLHGMLGAGSQWNAVMGRLAGEFRCWALEMPGISFSDAPADLTLPGLTHWLQAALAALGVAPYALLGSSWGGEAALHFALHAAPGERPRRLVLVAPAHPCWQPTLGQRFLLRPLPARCGAWLGARAPAGWQRRLLARCYADATRISELALADYARTLGQPRLGRAVAGYGRGFAGHQSALRAALRHNATPTLLLWGDHDPVVPTSTAAALAAALPQSRLVVLPGCGHLPFAEAPDAFAAAVLPFLH
ncbi:MAG: alpha/beta fold hydrolase [Terriglobales bacterium]